MKAIANPVEVEYGLILEVTPPAVIGGPYSLLVGWGGTDIRKEQADSKMCARMTPRVDDYMVIQSDGYVYLNPKEIFERKYSASPEAMELEFDMELCEWVYGILNGTPVPAGGFLKTVAHTATAADPFNYAILRPALLRLKAKYPNYEGKKSL